MSLLSLWRWNDCNKEDNHDEIKMHDNPESKIKFEDIPRVVQCIEVNIKYKNNVCWSALQTG